MNFINRFKIMMYPKFLFWYCTVFIAFSISAQTTNTYSIATVAFYNLENLFDTKNDPKTYDDDRTPKGKDHWTIAQYHDKVKNMAMVISEIGVAIAHTPPAIIGVAEIENKKVLQDLIATPSLAPYKYDIVHFDSPDRRGIDVALLFQKNRFRPLYTSTHTVYLYDIDIPTKRVYTRDQLLVSGFLDGEFIHVFVNHWPSRRGGAVKSNYKRMRAATQQKRCIDSLFSTDPYAKIIVMGDFNDDPHSSSIQDILNAKAKKKQMRNTQLYNPMAAMAKHGVGSLAWGDQWNLFDQILVSQSFTNTKDSTYTYYKAGIFNPTYLTQRYGRYQGYPFRSFANGHYTGGYSDHFPVYLYLIKKVKEKKLPSP